MSKSKRLRNQASSDLTGLGLNGSLDSSETDKIEVDEIQPTGTRKDRMLTALRGRWWAVGLIAVLSLSALGGTLKYLEQDAQRITAQRQRLGYLKKPEESALSKLNPFLSAPPPAPTPQLSKEMIYSSGRLLAVEDANANPFIPVDLAIWRPSNGTFYIMGSGSTLAASAGWGIVAGDKTVAGDYDGDGKTDFAVYRPGTTALPNAAWHIIKSSDPSGASYIDQNLGTTGDIPVPADYDGDHRTDLAVYRAGTTASPVGNWYILKSSDSTLLTYSNAWVAGDVPVPADYDGDSQADSAVFRPGSSTVYVVRSSDGGTQNGQLSTTITSGQTAVPCDYDGDGKADYAMRSSSNWTIKPSAGGSIQTISWYSRTDVTVQNDYDGDGKCDIAVWKAPGSGTDALGTWYIRQSSHLGQSNELRTEIWGQAGDIPVPALWRR